MKPYFSFDMGVESKLSRFRLWTRLQYMYRLHHLRTFTVYGTNDAAVTKDPDNWEGWIKLMDCESFRPSGQIIGGEPNAEEKEHMLAGEEWEFPVDVPKVRYLKFQVHTTWGDTMVHLSTRYHYGVVLNKEKKQYETIIFLLLLVCA